LEHVAVSAKVCDSLLSYLGVTPQRSVTRLNIVN